MLLIDALIEVFDKHKPKGSIIDLNDKVAHEIAEELKDIIEKQVEEQLSNELEEAEGGLWSLEARRLLEQVLPILEQWKKESISEQRRIDYGVLIYKIEELLIKNK